MHTAHMQQSPSPPGSLSSKNLAFVPALPTWGLDMAPPLKQARRSDCSSGHYIQEEWVLEGQCSHSGPAYAKPEKQVPRQCSHSGPAYAKPEKQVPPCKT